MFLRCLVSALALTVYQLSPSAPAVFPGTNYSRTCPFPPLDWKWCGLPLQGRHHHYTHISVRDSASARGPPSPQSWRNDNYDIHPLNRHEIVQLPCPLFQHFFFSSFFFFWLIQYYVGSRCLLHLRSLIHNCRISQSDKQHTNIVSPWPEALPSTQSWLWNPQTTHTCGQFPFGYSTHYRQHLPYSNIFVFPLHCKQFVQL